MANSFNSFYHEVRILAEENEEKKRAYLALIQSTEAVLESCLTMLGMEVPERM
ncbi:MAG: DALR anticodon-binding domain-containing protein [Lachnospiraceae bacterium]